MMFESDSEWPEMLKYAILAANTCWKRSTGYTPFYLMYGREANSVHLFKFRNFYHRDDLQRENESIEVDTTQNSPVDTQECPEYLEEINIDREKAQENIQSEQLVQKCIFYKKVKKNR